MKKIIHLSLVISMLVISSISVFAQEIPQDSLYLGQTPPGNIPKLFPLTACSESFAAERIAISDDGKEIYYTGIRGYYPTAGDTIKYYYYVDNSWSGPFNLFNGYLAPELSVTGDTMYFQNNNVPYQTLYSVRTGTNWSNPQRILYNLNSAHYLQVTNNGNYYISSISNPTLGASDWCNLKISGTDTSVVSLGLPVSTNGDNLDFYISRDESFIITAKPQPVGLSISYHKTDGGWTNPKSLGSDINFGLGMWGPFVTADKKYLFYTTGTKMDYSDTYVYWVRIDSLIDNLEQTNFIPYLNYKIPNQTVSVGHIYNYTFPVNTFIDDDGNNTLTYSATLSDGNPLPAWLSFDPLTRILSGIPTSAGTLTIKITATDAANTKAFCTFNLKINNPVSVNDGIEGALNDSKLYRNFPNPFNRETTRRFSLPQNDQVLLKISDEPGREVKNIFNKRLNYCDHSFDFDAENISTGIYFYVMKPNTCCEQKKMIVLK